MRSRDRFSASRLLVVASTGMFCLSFLGACSAEREDALATSASQSATEGVEATQEPANYRDMKGQEVEQSNAAGGFDVDPVQIRQVSDSGQVFSVPSVGLEVPLGSIVSYEGIIEPANFSSAFVVADYSRGFNDPNEGASVLVAHALDNQGEAPGNYLWDTQSSMPKTKIGDELIVADKHYVITGQESIKKDSIGDMESLWDDAPRTLKFITCVPNSDDNFVIFAKLKN